MQQIANELRSIADRVEHSSPGAVPIKWDEEGFSKKMNNGAVKVKVIEDARAEWLANPDEAHQRAALELPSWYLLELQGRHYTPAQREMILNEQSEYFIETAFVMQGASIASACRMDTIELPDGSLMHDARAVTAGNITGQALVERFKVYAPIFAKRHLKYDIIRVEQRERLAAGDTIPALNLKDRPDP